MGLEIFYISVAMIYMLSRRYLSFIVVSVANNGS